MHSVTATPRAGIKEILDSGRFPSFIISSGKTEQRKLEDRSAGEILKTCRWLEERDSRDFAIGMNPRIIKEVWESELKDPRKNSITERYDEHVYRAEEAASRQSED